MVKISSVEIEKQKIAKRIQILERDISDYHHNRGCIFFCSLFHDKTFIRDLYARLEEERKRSLVFIP
jgi:hypothetical protein